MQEIYKCVFKDLNQLEFENGDRRLYEIIFEEAERIVNLESESVANLENKVVLSLAIRLNAEKHMINQINNTVFVSSINKNQTGILLVNIRNFSQSI